MPAQVPWRIPSWLAGVVHGSWTVHSSSRCDPASTHERSVGISPAWSAHSMTGAGTPSSCTNSTPGTWVPSRPGSRAASRRASRSRLGTSRSPDPAVSSHASAVATPEAIHAAAVAVANEETCTPGTRPSDTWTTTAWPASAARTSPTQPTAEAVRTSTGRSSPPTTPVTRPASNHTAGEVPDRPGSSPAVIQSDRLPVSHVTTVRTASPGVGPRASRRASGAFTRPAWPHPERAGVTHCG